MKSDIPSQSDATPARPLSLADWLLSITAGLSLINLLGLWFWYYPGSVPIGATGGVWTALAYDFSKGIFYRPVFDDFGYGGTRYLFLFFILHGTLMRILHDPVIAGNVLVLGSAVLLSAGIYALLRRLGLRLLHAAACSALTTISISYQLVTLEIMGEFLACALNIWGVVFAVHYWQKKTNSFLIFSALCFAGSFLTKFSSLTGLTAVCLYFLLQKQYRPIFKLLAWTGSVVLFSLLVAYRASEGRMVDAFLAFGEGPPDWNYAFKFSLWFFMLLLRDPFLFLMFGFALFFIFKNKNPAWASFQKIYFFVTLAFTLIILTSRGTDYNHLLDLIVASVLILGGQMHKAVNSEKTVSVLFGVLIAGLIFTWLPGTISIKQFMQSHGGKPSREKMEQVIEKLGPQEINILSENPLIPILMGRRPEMLDAFALRRLSLAHPEIQKDFAGKLENQYFGAVILLDFSGAPQSEILQAMAKHSSPGAGSFYGGVHFPPGFLALLQERYTLGFVTSPYVVFFPKNISGVAPSR